MGTSPRTPPDKAALDAALTRKANLEADLLAEQLKPHSRRVETLKVLAGASGLLLAAISLGGGLFSIGSWFHDQAQNRELRIEERLERTLNQLSEPRTAPRIAAVGSISSFLTKGADERNTRVVAAIANAIALEDDQVVRNAMIAFFVDLNPDVVSRDSLNRALAILVSHNRGLITDRRNWSSGEERWFNIEPNRVRYMAGLARATASLMRHGARVRDMSALYLVRADFSGLDLSGINFDNSVLNTSDFLRSVLRRASFDGASLAATSFVAADLRQARFTVPENGFSFLELDLRRSAGPEVRRQLPGAMMHADYPDFACADLRGADFSGFPIWNVTSDDIRHRQQMWAWPKFDGANLANANFGQMRVFYLDTLRPREQSELFRYEHTSGSASDGDIYSFNRATLTARTPLRERPSSFGLAFDELRNAFGRSNLAGARFPPAVRPFLPPSPPRPPRDLECRPRSPW